MFRPLRRPQLMPTQLLDSKLHNEATFYSAFLNDLKRCRELVIIESPFITSSRIASLLPVLQQLKRRDVTIVVNTRNPQEHEAPWDYQAHEAVRRLQNIGVDVLYTGGHHRKLAILDRTILWEGSLNILSQNDSCEIMRRINSDVLATQMIAFTKIDKFLK